MLNRRDNNTINIEHIKEDLATLSQKETAMRELLINARKVAEFYGIQCAERLKGWAELWEVYQNNIVYIYPYYTDILILLLPAIHKANLSKQPTEILKDIATVLVSNKPRMQLDGLIGLIESAEERSKLRQEISGPKGSHYNCKKMVIKILKEFFAKTCDGLAVTKKIENNQMSVDDSSSENKNSDSEMDTDTDTELSSVSSKSDSLSLPSYVWFNPVSDEFPEYTIEVVDQPTQHLNDINWNKIVYDAAALNAWYRDFSNMQNAAIVEPEEDQELRKMIAISDNPFVFFQPNNDNSNFISKNQKENNQDSIITINHK